MYCRLQSWNIHVHLIYFFVVVFLLCVKYPIQHSTNFEQYVLISEIDDRILRHVYSLGLAYNQLSMLSTRRPMGTGVSLLAPFRQNLLYSDTRKDDWEWFAMNWWHSKSTFLLVTGAELYTFQHHICNNSENHSSIKMPYLQSIKQLFMKSIPRCYPYKKMTIEQTGLKIVCIRICEL